MADDSTDKEKKAEEKKDESAQSNDSPVVLIVEDDPVLARMYSEKFNFEGFKVVTAGNGEDALDLALKDGIDVILLDIMLPRMSGTDFLERLRKDSKGEKIPVVVLTNLAEEEEKKRAIDLGVKDYLVKAMQTPEQVIAKIKKYV